MRTLLIHQAFVSPNEPGGTRHYELARHCVDQGHAFTIVASDQSYLTGQRTTNGRAKLVIEEDIAGVRVLRAYTYPSLHRSFVWRVVAFLSFMVTSVVAGLRAGPVDLVIGTTPPIFQALSAWLVAVLRRRPFLLEIRDLWPEFAIGMGVLTNPVLIVGARLLESFLYAQATHLLVNSPAYRDYLIKKGIRVDKITLIANGVDPSMFNSEDQGLHIRSTLHVDDKFVITYAGAIGLANDIPTILNAAEILKDNSQIHFLLVGDGKERAKLEDSVRARNLTNVTFTGSRPKSDMAGILAASDACLATLQDIPMFRTTYPNKVFDYMAAARPTILGIDGVIRDVIEAANGGIFVQPGSARALADAVAQLAAQPDTAQEMGRSARAYVVEHFNRADQSRAFTDLIRRIATRS